MNPRLRSLKHSSSPGRTLLLGLLVGLFGIVAAGTETGISLEERFGLSTLFRIRGGMAVPPDVAIVGIDQAGSEELGIPVELGQWDRETYAQVVDNLVAAGASVIGMDIFFGGPRSQTGDQSLAESIERSRRTLLLEDVESGSAGTFATETIRRPDPMISAGASGISPFNLPDLSGGLLWQFRAFWELDNEIYPTMPVMAIQIQALSSIGAFRARLGETRFSHLDEIPADPDSLTNPDALRQVMRILRAELKDDARLQGDVVQALDSGTDMVARQKTLWRRLIAIYGGPDTYYMNFYGPAGTLPVFPLRDALRGPAGKEFEEKAVFVGEAELFGASTGYDTFQTVFRRRNVDLSGVEVLATAFANLLTDRVVRQRLDVHLGALLVVGMLGSVLASLMSGVRAIASVLALGLGYSVLTYLTFTESDLWMPLVTPLALQLPLALITGLFLQFRTEKTRSDEYRPWVPDKVARRPKQTGTVFGVVLRTDVVRSTDLSERLGDPEWARLQSQYLDLVRSAAVRQGGWVLETRGDDVVCFWQSASRDDELKRRAAATALDIQKRLRNVNAQEPEDRRIAVRTGLHAGSVHMGDTGPVGDVLNTVSRIERENERHGTRILASDAFIDGLNGFAVRSVGEASLKGKSRPMLLYEVLENEPGEE